MHACRRFFATYCLSKTKKKRSAARRHEFDENATPLPDFRQTGRPSGGLHFCAEMPIAMPCLSSRLSSSSLAA
jgi:hypothetical protein